MSYNPNIKRKYKLELEYGPYCHAYTRNGRYLILGGEKGHLALIDWQRFDLKTEVILEEKVNSVCALYDETLFAAAQQKYTYIYDSNGIEIHCLKKNSEVFRLVFLPYHFLLSSIGRRGHLIYVDVSTGEQVSYIKTNLGPCHVMEQNPWNAIMHLGHIDGTVTLWSPKTNEPLVKMLCHKGGVTSINVDGSGRYMVTSGNHKIKIWDLRKHKKALSNKKGASTYNCVSLSQKNILAVAKGPRITLWEQVFSKQMDSPVKQFLLPGLRIQNLRFCPFEDALGVSHEKGFTSLVAPGSGEPDFDCLDLNPFETKKERQNRLVKALIEKIQPEFITLDPNKVASVRTIKQKK